MTKRMTFIDQTKILAIFLVILYHSGIKPFIMIDNNMIICFINFIFQAFLSMGVPLFFVVNGYLLFSKELINQEHIKRMLNILVVSVFWGIIIATFYMICGGENFNIPQLFLYVWDWKQGWINHFWFLHTLFGIYVFFPLIKCCYDNNKKIFFMFVISTGILTIGEDILHSIAEVGIYIVTGDGKKLAIDMFNRYNPYKELFGFAYFYFCLGGVFLYYQETIKKVVTKYKYIFMSLLILALSGLAIFGMFQTVIANNTYDVVFDGYGTIFTAINTVIVFSFIMVFHVKKEHVCKICATISNNTLGIYILHGVIINFTKEIATRYGIFENIVCGFLYSIGVMVLSLIITLILKKLPIMRNLL